MKVLVCASSQLLTDSLCQSINHSIRGAKCIEGCHGDIHNSLKIHKPDILILEPDNNQDNSILFDLHIHFPQVQVLLLLPEGVPDEIKAAYIMEGIAGYLNVDCSHEKLCAVLEVIQNGQMWVERRVLAIALQSFVALRTQYDWAKGEKKALTEREKEIMSLVASGRSNKEVAGNLHISEATIKTHLYHIYRKLGVQSRLKALWHFSMDGSKERKVRHHH